MTVISKATAIAIAVAYQEIERGEKLLADVHSCISERRERLAKGAEDLRDAFGHRQRSLTLGVPSGDNGHRLCDVSYELAVPVIEAHIANKRSQLSALSLKAKTELGG